MARPEEKETVAPESEKTRRAKQKLLGQWEYKKRQVTKEAIEKTAASIRKWIADNSQNRVIVKEKISLFDKNENSAGQSRKVKEIAEKLKDGLNFLS